MMTNLQSNLDDSHVTLESLYAVPVQLMDEMTSTGKASVCILITAPREDIVGMQGSAGLL